MTGNEALNLISVANNGKKQSVNINYYFLIKFLSKLLLRKTLYFITKRHKKFYQLNDKNKKKLKGGITICVIITNK